MHSFSISNVAFTGPAFQNLRGVPSEIGVEIFYEWGGSRFYADALEALFRDRSGKFSIHAPFQYIDFSAPCDESELFSYLSEPFELYHRFQANGYVIHTDAPRRRPYSDAESREARLRVEERLIRFHELARAAGVNLLVENLCDGADGFHLFSEAQYLQLFLDHPELDCLIDVGHAHVQRFDLAHVQRTLGARIRAYHLHDNDGIQDAHLPLFSGSFDWASFARNAAVYTPDAHMILEYGSPAGVEGMLDDIRALMEMFKAT